MPPSYDYDLLVIGSGPAGQRAAIQGAKLDKRVAIVERTAVLGGICVNLGTIPSKTLREAVLELSGYRSREFYGASYTVKQNITLQDLLVRTNTTRDPQIPLDGKHVFTSDDVLKLDRLPRTLSVVGAGVIGCEYASIFAALGVRVTLIDKRNRLLPFVDEEIIDTLCYHLRENRVTLRLNESVERIDVAEDSDGPGSRVRLHLESGKTIVTEKALYSVGRSGATGRLALDKCGIACDER